MIFKKGNIPWNKGLTKESSESLKRQGICPSQILKEKFKEGIYKKEYLLNNKGCFKKGRKFSNEQEIKRIEALRKKGAWNKGLTKETDKSVKRIAEKLKGKQATENHRKKLKGKHNSPKTEFKIGHQINSGRIHSKQSKMKYRFSKLGKNNPQWQGGISFEPYDKSFNNKFKRAIRKRDNQICMLCGIHREKLKRALDVHHINYNKQMSIPQNCISLCASCHMKTNKDRKIWTKHFQALLNKKYDYKYSETNEIILEINN